MAIDDLAGWVLATLLLSLRVAPAFAFAPPFTLTRVPAPFRLLLGLGLSACMVALHPGATLVPMDAGVTLASAARELVLGGLIVLVLQLMFAALYVAGRTVDIQAGFGLALLIDPSTRGQMPLVGTLFAYAAGAVFFAMGGHLELVRILSASLDAIPIGGGGVLPPLGRLTAFLGAVFVTSFGIAGGAILCLFLADLAIALLSRTAPQMNVLVLGFQVKAALMFIVLPLSFGASGALFTRLARITLEAVPRFL